MLIAITRQVSPSINQCELTNLERIPIDLETARRQHRQYEAALESLGVEVHSLPADADLPDSVFVEDAAIVLDECAILTRPGADSRRPEIETIAQAISPYRKLAYIQAPGTLDGGDVLRLDDTIFVGLSTRSNWVAAEQMKACLAPYRYVIREIDVHGCLHLKSAVTQVAPGTLLINPAWVERAVFHDLDFIDIDPSEPHAANAMMVGDTVIYQPAYPKTCRRLEQAGVHPVLVDASELGKAEGGLTCCALIFEA